ncbi:MAG TPA: hypothetical protein VFW23_16175 [Tepidisphaeraceae bacterium]|nr:hypothetical protein [Tepidisphaeraceae bacterium]
MRAIPLFAAAIMTLGLTEAGAQPKMNATEPAITANVPAYDDLNCAARYTLAAFVIQTLDGSAAAYYAQRATDAGKRYLALHPGESEQSYNTRVTTNAQDIQARLATNAITPEGLVAEIKHCDQDSDTRTVT